MPNFRKTDVIAGLKNNRKTAEAMRIPGPAAQAMNGVSVIIPNYNRETLIGETISNLLKQSLPPCEIIIVDDGSTDKSVEIIRSCGAKIKQIQQNNPGAGAARNAGLRAAIGEFIQFQDSDDLFSLNKMAVQAKLLEQTGADIAFSPWVKLSD